MTRKRLAVVVPTWKKECGVAEYTKQLIDHLSKKHFDIRVYAEVDARLGERVLKDEGSLVHFQYEHSIYDFTSLYEAMRVLKNAKVPIVTTLHSWSARLIERNLLISAMSDRVIVHSEAKKKHCLAHGFDERQLTVMPMGCHRHTPDPQWKTEARYGIDGSPRIGFFGFPFPHKGMIALTNALRQLHAVYPGLKGYFFSHYPDYLDRAHPYYTFFQDLERAFSHRDYLVWNRSFLPDETIVSLLHTMDVNVLPYEDHDQKGISAASKLMLEAGKPVVTTDDLYFSDLKGEVYKMPDADENTIALSIDRVLNNPSLNKRLLRCANAFLEKNDWKQVGKRYADFYCRIIKHHE